MAVQRGFIRFRLSSFAQANDIAGVVQFRNRDIDKWTDKYAISITCNSVRSG